MSDDGEDKSKGDYEVGFGKPPKEHQFKPKPRPDGSGGTTKSKRSKLAADKQKVDLLPLLNEPVPVKKNGKVRKMSAFEAALHKQVEQAVKHSSPAAIKAIIDLATKFDLFETPPSVNSGGVLIVPIRTHEDMDYLTECYLSSRTDVRAKVRT